MKTICPPAGNAADYLKAILNSPLMDSLTPENIANLKKYVADVLKNIPKWDDDINNFNDRPDNQDIPENVQSSTNNPDDHRGGDGNA